MSSDRRMVLIVEDDPDIREMYTMALRMGGFDVRSAGDGVSALHQLEQEVPSAMVLDLDLPCVSGLDVQDELEAHAETRGVPVVVVSGTDWPAGRQVYARLRKPVTPEALVKIVRRATIRQPAH